MKRKNFKIGLIVLTIGIVIASCGGRSGSGGSGGLSGTWEYKYNENNAITIKLSGKTFTREVISIDLEPMTKEQIIEQLTNMLNKEGVKFSQSKDKIEFSKDGREGIITFLGTENGQTKIETRRIEKFTYSITDDKIELIDSKGSIDILSFSRTENTITIDGQRLIKK